MHNSASLLQSDPGTLAEVRRRVAYQEKLLPPVHVQRIIKSYFAAGVSKYRAHAQLFGSDAAGALWATGWGSNRLTERQVDSVIHTPGFWDGWVPLVSTSGWFSSGLVPLVLRVIEVHLRQQCTLVDVRQRPDPSRTRFDLPPLWSHQQEALEAFWREGRGVMDVPPRCGK